MIEVVKVNKKFGNAFLSVERPNGTFLDFEVHNDLFKRIKPNMELKMNIENDNGLINAEIVGFFHKGELKRCNQEVL
jgi:hypothetical protein